MGVIGVMAHSKSVVLKIFAECLPRLVPTPPSLLGFPRRRRRSEGHGEQNGGCILKEAARVQQSEGSATKGVFTPSFKL